MRVAGAEFPNTVYVSSKSSRKVLKDDHWTSEGPLRAPSCGRGYRLTIDDLQTHSSFPLSNLCETDRNGLNVYSRVLCH